MENDHLAQEDTLILLHQQEPSMYVTHSPTLEGIPGCICVRPTMGTR